MREFLKWLQERFSFRTFGAVLCVFLSMLCIWIPGVILATRFWAYVLGVPVPDLGTILFPLGRVSAVLMVFCFGVLSVYFVYARDMKWGNDDDSPKSGEK